MFLDRGRYWLCRKFKKFPTEETTWVDTQGMKAPTVLCMRPTVGTLQDTE